MQVRTLLVALLVLFAGCVGGVPSDSPGDQVTDTTTDDTSSTTTPALTAANNASLVSCDESLWVSYYGLSSKDRIWDSDSVTIGYTIPASAGYHFVAYENGTVLGSEYQDVEYPVTADGDAVEFGRELSGEHTVRVVVHRDDGDGTFDPDTDPVCTDDGERVRTDPVTLNFSSLSDDEPSKTSQKE